MIANFWESEMDNNVKCILCPHYCVIVNNRLGYCNTRRHINGELIVENYGQVTSLAFDPIEKKPLYHFRPGSKILSVGSYGCNMKCAFCQNYSISQIRAESEYITPEKLADLSADTPDNIGVAFTYNEPTIGIEYILSAAPMIRNNGQNVVLVSNGQINSEPLTELLPLIDAWNIDIKAFRPEFYRRYGGDLETAKHTVDAASQVSHVEVTTLIIPGENDNEDEIAALARWLAGISTDIPLHLSRFFPQYKMTDKPPTPKETLLRFAEIAKLRLKYVYIGNV
ncbi:MAG: AmmeMemoRadiSam system radical SAM enzyme [Oscillospiraceae bacterium]|nr:AmmeMemoRadiSam system radical SAM enzyme [Oscillospiraceae bacterium]